MSYLGNPLNSVAFLTDQFSGNGSTTVFTMSVAPATTSSILVAISGVVQDPTTYSVVGTTLTFSAAPPSGTGNVSVRYLGIPASGVTTTAYRTVTDTTATAGQTTFSIPSYTVGYLNVYQNGVRLGAADFTATNGTTVVLTVAAALNDLITTESFYVSSVTNAIPAVAGAVNSTYITDAAVTQQKLGSNVAGNGPAFSAYSTITQTISASTFTTIQCNVEEFDTGSCYNNTGSTVNGIPAYSFMPSVAGYYQINGVVNRTSSTGEMLLSFFKNGSEFKRGADMTAGWAVATNAIVYLNGTTDYVDSRMYFASTLVTNPGQALVYFQASLVRAA